MKTITMPFDEYQHIQRVKDSEIRRAIESDPRIEIVKNLGVFFDSFLNRLDGYKRGYTKTGAEIRAVEIENLCQIYADLSSLYESIVKKSHGKKHKK